MCGHISVSNKTLNILFKNKLKVIYVCTSMYVDMWVQMPPETREEGWNNKQLLTIRY